MTGLFLLAAVSLAAARVLITQVIHRRYAGTAPAEDTWEMALFSTSWSAGAAMASAAARLLLGHLLPAPLSAGFDSATAGAAAGLVGAIACVSVGWTVLIVGRTWMAAYRKTKGSETDEKKRIDAATDAAVPVPPDTETADEAKRARDAVFHTISVLTQGVVLGGVTGGAVTLAVGESANPVQQTLASLATWTAIATGGVSAARWLQLGTDTENDGDDPGGPRAASPTT